MNAPENSVKTPDSEETGNFFPTDKPQASHNASALWT